MFRNPKRMGRWMAIAVAIGLVCSAEALAKKPPPPDDDSGAGYTIVPFLTPVPRRFESVHSLVLDLNDQGHGWVEDFQEELPDGSYQTVHWALHLDMAPPALHGVQDCNYPVGRQQSQPDRRRTSWKAVPACLRSGTALPLPRSTCLYSRETRRVTPRRSTTRGSSWGSTTIVRRKGVVWRVFVDENGDVSFVDGPLPLPPLDGDTGAWGSDLNELIDGSFQVSGYSREDDGGPEAVVWTIGVNPDGTLATPDRR